MIPDDLKEDLSLLIYLRDHASLWQRDEYNQICFAKQEELRRVVTMEQRIANCGRVANLGEALNGTLLP
jgi:hypothetical protein